MMTMIFFCENSDSIYFYYVYHSFINLRLFILIACEQFFSFMNVTSLNSSLNEMYENKEDVTLFNIRDSSYFVGMYAIVSSRVGLFFLGHARDRCSQSRFFANVALNVVRDMCGR